VKLSSVWECECTYHANHQRPTGVNILPTIAICKRLIGSGMCEVKETRKRNEKRTLQVVHDPSHSDPCCVDKSYFVWIAS